MNVIQVVCAIIIVENKVLAVKRGEAMKHPGQWEFPGGKIETGEEEEQALVRELQEELNLTVKPIRKLTPNLHQYGEKSIELHPWQCVLTNTHSMQLREHSEMKWCTAQDLLFLSWCEADIPIAEEVSKLLSVR